MRTAHPHRHLTASNVSAEIARQHYRQADIASWLGISQPSVSAKINGQTPFDIDELGVIAEHLGLPVEALVAAPPFPVPGRMKEAGRPEGRPAKVAGAGFEPATSGLRVEASYVAVGLYEAEMWANSRVGVWS